VEHHAVRLYRFGERIGGSIAADEWLALVERLGLGSLVWRLHICTGGGHRVQPVWLELLESGLGDLCSRPRLLWSLLPARSSGRQQHQ